MNQSGAWHEKVPKDVQEILQQYAGRKASGSDSASCGDESLEGDEVEALDLGDFRDELNDCFSSTERIGSFAWHSTLEHYPNPGLKVDGIGTVGLPLSDRDMTALKNACHQAPFGKGSETIVDETVRKTWEINACNVQTSNQSWDNWIQNTIVQNVTEQIGVEAEVRRHTRAEFYKLLLYEQGAHFKPHQDSEKALGMYGTLVVCLPTRHEGGEVLLRHGRDVKSYASALSSDTGLSYAAWYSDVMHEVKPVITGHRLVLTYNLINHSSHGSIPSAAQVISSDQMLEDTLKNWKKFELYDERENIVKHLSYILEHQYSEESLTYTDLKGHDKRIVSQTVRVGSKVGFTVCLATLEQSSSDTYDEDDDTHWQLTKVFDLEGNVITTSVSIEEDLVIQKDPFEDEEPDDEEVDEYTGNEGALSTRWYRRSVMIIVPSSNMFRLILDLISNRGGVELERAVQRFDGHFLRDPANAKAREDLASFCSIVLDEIIDQKKIEQEGRQVGGSNVRGKFPDKSISGIATCCAGLGRADLFSKALDALHTAMTTQFWHGFACRTGPQNFHAFESLLVRAIDQINSISSKLYAIEQMREGFEYQFQNPSIDRDGFLDSYDCWSRHTFDSTLLARNFVVSDDAEALLRTINVFGGDVLFQSIFPFVHKMAFETPFVIRFLCSLTTCKSQFITEEHEAEFQKRVEELVSATSKDVKIAEFGDVAAHSRPSMFEQLGNKWAIGRTPFGERKILDYVDGRSLALLYKELSRKNHEEKARALVEKYVERGLAQVKNAGALYERTIFEFLKHLKLSLDALQTPLDAPWVQQIFISVFTAYMTDWVQTRPRPPENWAFSRLPCSCGDCNQVSLFLLSQSKEHLFTGGDARRRHLREGLVSFPVTTSTRRANRAGQPHSLVITKTDSEYKARLRDWEHRVATAQGYFHMFAQQDLQLLLGNSLDGLTRLAFPKAPKTNEGRPLAQIAQPNTGPYAISSLPAKRKAEDSPVVDLTRD